MTSEQRLAFLTTGGFSQDQARLVSDNVDHLMELETDFKDSRREEALRRLDLHLQKLLGPEGSLKLDAFLFAVREEMRTRRGICNGGAVVHTYGTLLRSPGSMAAIAVTDSGEGSLYAEATLKSPEKREITARSPAQVRRIRATAAAPLLIGMEDGTYQSTYRFGEFCGAGKDLKLYEMPTQ